MDLHSKHKGTLAEVKVIADLYEKGYLVAVPMDDLCPFDLILIDGPYLYKIQVKYCRKKKNSIRMDLRNSMSNKTLQYKKYYTKDEVDIFAIYCPDINKCLYINNNILDTNRNSFAIYIGDTKNGQKMRINNIKDFEELKL